MKKEDLIALGLDEKQADEVLKMRGQELSEMKSLRAENSSLKSDAEKHKSALDVAQGRTKELENQVKELDTTKAALEAAQQQIKQNTLDNAMAKELSASGARDNDVIKALLDSSSISLNDKGELEGIADQLKALKESKPYLFKQDKADVSGSNPKRGSSARVSLDDAIKDSSVNLTELITKTDGGN